MEHDLESFPQEKANMRTSEDSSEHEIDYHEKTLKFQRQETIIDYQPYHNCFDELTFNHFKTLLLIGNNYCPIHGC